MPEGPLGGPRPGAESFQSLEFGVFGDIPPDETKRIGEKLKEVFGTDKAGTQTTSSIEGGILVVPLKTDRVFKDNIERFLSEVESENLADSVWSVTARTEGKNGGVRPLAEAKQDVVMKLLNVPREIKPYESLYEGEAFSKLTKDSFGFSTDEIDSVSVNFDENEIRVTLNKNKVDNTSVTTIETRAGRIPKDVADAARQSEYGGIDEMEFDQVTEFSDKLHEMAVNQVIVESK